MSISYETVAASQTDQVLGQVGKKGDRLDRLIVTVDTVGAGGEASIKDGSGSAIPVAPASGAIGVYYLELGVTSTDGPWKVTTGANVTIIAIGEFNATG